jgi:uncharacterized membrane protein YiaA
VFVVYAIQFGGLLQALMDPAASGAVRTILGFIPSSWGAWVIVGFAGEPGGLGGLGLQAILRLAGLAVFLLGSFWVGSRIADRAYSLEPTSFTSPEVGPDGPAYRTLRSVTGGRSFSVVFTSILKEYARRLENMSRLGYTLGAMLIVSIFMSRSRESMSFAAVVPFMIAQFVLPILTVFVTGEVTLKGKEALFIIRKAPSGLGRFIWARLLQGWLVIVPIAAVVAIATTIGNPHATLLAVLPNVALLIALAAGAVAFVLGLFLLSPAFSEKSGRFYLNMLVVVGFTLGCFIVLAAFVTHIMEGDDPFRGMMYLQAFQTALTWVAGLLLVGLGRWNLARME